MDVRSLQQFLAVVEHGTLGRAADALHITQSALTKSIQRLEQSLKVELLERSRSGVKPTPYGLAVLPYARSVGLETAHLRDALTALKAGMTGRVVLGAGPSLVASVVPLAIGRIAARAPGLQVQVVEDVVVGLLRRLQAGEVDFFIGTAVQHPLDRRLQAELLFKDRISIVAGKAHQVHRRRNLDLADLLEFTWALPEPGHSLAQGCERIFQAARLAPPVPAVVTNSLSCLEALLMAGTHVSVAPTFTRAWARDAYRPLRVEGGSWGRDIWLYERADPLRSPAVEAFIAELRVAAAAAPA